MRTRWLVVISFAAALVACGSNNPDTGGDDQPTKPQCSDGIDNDGDGKIDFPDDLGCTSPEDDSEDSLPAPACSDGRDNDGDGKIDFPDDPGCFSANADDETDDCPDGPNCPQCSNGKDDDGNGSTDYPDDPGCTSAADNEEFTASALTCSMITVKQLPASGMDSGTLDGTSSSDVHSPCGGGGGAAAIAYQIHLTEAKVVVATTDTGGTTADTVIDIRSADHCELDTSELGCNDDADPDAATSGDTASTATASLLPGNYFIIVEGRDSSQIGTYQLQVSFFAGEGSSCTNTDCGPGLVCHTGVCEKPRCSNGKDDDGDGKIDFPNEPGCTDALDDDETDDCPSGPNCPVCSNGLDDDHDGKTDFPDDPSCASAAGTSESCVTTEGVTSITAGTTSGDTTGATNDYETTCAFETGGADLTFELDIPTMSTLHLTLDNDDPNDFAFLTMALLNTTCKLDGTDELACQESFGNDSPALIDETNFAGGSYFIVVDGDFTTDTAPFRVVVSGTIAKNESCEGTLAQSGAITCEFGSACKGTAGSRTCQPAACSDGVDNNGDGLIDFPNDPGCTSPSDDVEDDVCPGPDCPVCSDGIDNDGDGKKDFPLDPGCKSASGTSEDTCEKERDPLEFLTTPTVTGTLDDTVDHHDIDLSCRTGGVGDGLDHVYLLTLPVDVQSLHLDTLDSLDIFDTVLGLLPATCAKTELACNDDDDADFSLLSLIDTTNVPAGSYAVVVQGFSDTDVGEYGLSVHGTVAKGKACTDALFTTGVLACEAGSTCTAGTCQ